jgi:hypothetical protein
VGTYVREAMNIGWAGKGTILHKKAYKVADIFDYFIIS